MTSKPPRLVSPWAGLGLAVLLSFLLMAGFVTFVLHELDLVLPYDRVTAALSVNDIAGSILGRQLAAFVCAVAVCHVLVGLGAFALARLTELAFPGGTIARRRWLIVGWFMVLAGLAMAANSTWYPASIFAGR